MCDIRDDRGLNARIHDIRGVGEITTIDEFKERALGISKRSRPQTRKEPSIIIAYDHT